MYIYVQHQLCYAYISKSSNIFCHLRFNNVNSFDYESLLHKHDLFGVFT